jgi:hypothetical protein
LAPGNLFGRKPTIIDYSFLFSIDKEIRLFFALPNESDVTKKEVLELFDIGISRMAAEKQLEFLMNGEEARQVTISKLVIAGWTGRNVEAMEAHIAELEEMGIARPSKTPTFYRCTVDQLTTDDMIQVIGDDSSGEIEFIMVSLEDGLWVGLGSDHTDRKIEAIDVTVSKQMCAKPIAKTLWKYDDVKDHWDDLMLKSTIINDRFKEDYQEGPVTTMRSPEELIALYTSGGELPEGTLMFCGTLAVQGGVRPAEYFDATLTDPVLGREINYQYQAESLPPEE